MIYKNELDRLVENGAFLMHKIGDLARRFNMTPTNFGIRVKELTGRLPSEIKHEQMRKFILEHLGVLDISEIANNLGVSRGTIYRHIEEMGLDIKKGGDRKSNQWFRKMLQNHKKVKEEKYEVVH